MLIYHPDKRLDGINLLQFLSASVMEEAGSVANPLADESKPRAAENWRSPLSSSECLLEDESE